MPANRGMGQQQGSIYNFGDYPAPGVQYGDPLGLNLGLNRRGRAGFRQATITPDHPERLQSFFAQHKRAGKRFAQDVGQQGFTGDVARAYQQGGVVDPRNFVNPTPVPPPPPYQPIDPGQLANQTAPPQGTGIGPQFFDQRNQLLQAMQTPMNDVYNAYMRSFQRGGPLDIPSFQELYGSYRDVAEREAKRRSGDINEALGARGARFGSDILNAQAGLQRDLASDLRQQSGQFLTGLQQQQYNQLFPLGQQQQQANDIAMQRLLAQYATMSAPPPLFTGQQPNFQQPTTVLY